MIGQYLIDLVDDAGYVPADLGQAAERLGASQADVEAVLATLQTFDPPGICARNLSECLAIQLRELNRYDPAMQALVEISICWPSAISPPCESCAASTTKTSPT